MRDRVLAKLRENPERYLSEYTNGFGNVLNADDAATLFDEYNQDRAGNRVAVHPAAQWIRDELFRRALPEPVPADKNRVVFTAGGNAAGKSSALQRSGAQQEAHVLFDSSFSNPEHARQLLQRSAPANPPLSCTSIGRSTTP